MRKFYLFVAALAGSMLFFSCSKEIEQTTEPSSEEGFEYIFRISDETGAPTRTTIDGNTVKWEAGDKIGIFAEGSVNKFGSISTLDPVQFPVYLASPLSKDDMVYCYYPYNKNDNDSKTAEGITLKIPASQAVDFDAMPQVSLPYKVSADMAAGNNNVDDLYFCNLGSIARFLVYSSTGAYNDETISSIKFTANTALAGSFTFNLTTVDYDNPSTLAITGLSSLWAETTATAAIGTSTSNAGVINLVIAPGAYFGTIELTTDKAIYTYTISEDNKITFNRSKAKRIGLDLESATCTRVDPHPVGEVFVPATSIAAGDKILITSGNTGSIYVMGYQKSNNRDAVSYNSDGCIISTSAMYPMVVAAGTTNSSYFTLYDSDEGGYLAAASTSSNNLKTNPTVSVDAEWEISLDDTGKATTFQATGSSNRKVMQFNSGSSLFSCYASASQSDVYVFKKTTATTILAADQDIAYTVTSVEIPYNVYNASGATTVAFKTNPSNCASNLAINESTNKVTFDITANDGATRIVEVNITNNGVTKTVTINQAAAPSKLVMSSITATPSQNQIVFNWTEVADAEGYQVSTNGGTTFGSTQTATSFTWDELNSFTDYTIKVKAIGDGVYFLDSDAGTLTAKTTLAIPTSITWTKGTKTVSWTDTNTGAGTYGTDYKYQYTIDNGESFTDVAAPGSSVELNITETKSFKIKAVYISDAGLNSALSDALTCTMGADAIYTANFEGASEHRTSGTNNYGSNSYTVGGVEWTLEYSDAVSSTKLEGSYNITMRTAKKTNNCPYIQTGNILSSTKSITKITYLYQAQSTKYHSAQTLEYSTNGGTSWTTITPSKDSTVDENYGYSYSFGTPVSTSSFMLKFTVTCTGHDNINSTTDSYLDNVIVYGE